MPAKNNNAAKKLSFIQIIILAALPTTSTGLPIVKIEEFSSEPQKTVKE